ncbi:hypothetical protein BOTBODRAFT_31849 [Botryobasidium botryosum FD-172 SS1]|uniref:Nudix hydrolase domain-containing protein n=1 Tax=Botryobasidium botryosum (strain FD-172 SS1) TaxID=930990 RepID=A0A067MUH8_BOTB1|nr:hypothetical protein BOTBODRAFT_31849 [Botryobasidium botryosum FD-172 SS1]
MGPPRPDLPLLPESRVCLRNLARHRPQQHAQRFPRARSAAVLVALFVGRTGHLHVLLSRRADTLKSFPGDTALPGGKYEEGDKSAEDTARREAFEEIGLPIDRRRTPLLCTLQPFLSRNDLIVIPVVVLITDPNVKPMLNEPEVAALFSHPLHSFLSSTAPFPMQEGDRAYHTFEDVMMSERPVRMHRFLTGREHDGIKPVFGFTAGILLHTAMVGYGTKPDFEVDAPGQRTMPERIEYALENNQVLKEAVEKERAERHRRRERRIGSRL